MSLKASLSLLSVALFPILTACVSLNPYIESRGRKCPPFSGNFTVSAYQLYPENGDFDFNNCVLYTGNLWNSSLGVYDPYRNKIKVVEFEGITHNPDLHLGGVQYNHNTNLLSIVVDAGAAFNTNGQDISGTNYIILWDPRSEKILYQHNLTTLTQGKYGAFQDIEHDPDDNTYVVGTFPSSIVKVSKSGKKVEPWYVNTSVNHTVAGYGGLATKGWTLITNDQQTGSLYRFDMRAKRGTPTLIKVTPPHRFANTDAIQLPRRYKGTVLLVAELGIGFGVYRDKKAYWEEAEFLGLVEWKGDPGFFLTAPLQVGDGVYANLEPFGDPGLNGPGTAGNRTDFLYWDITAKVDELLKNRTSGKDGVSRT
ncbi:hypothetical protein P154DRAFT_615759 [Amniculicola lignicola CBS 123094]|uniref:Uncharacterized protein n=1 Tax=Amniculicola lignicola CBS 123094 TaxID=1392246 RepID=A0A6A5X2L9_9PLEO|nr:hypothetical protein P154DRAFT_615759 [Amniculicola lignicola CBS 123094]